jgi:sulfiredoxin
MVLKRQILAIQDVYVPVKRRQTLDPHKVEAMAESIMDKGQDAPILVRLDGHRFVLVEGSIAWKPARRLGRQLFRPIWFRRVSTDRCKDECSRELVKARTISLRPQQKFCSDCRELVVDSFFQVNRLVLGRWRGSPGVSKATMTRLRRLGGKACLEQWRF